MRNLWRNWSTHNLIGHPLSEIAHLLGLDEWARILHDSTLPADPRPFGPS